jgi:hypothetical protein
VGGHIAVRAGRGICIAVTFLGLTIAATRAETPSPIVDNFPGAAFETTTPEAAGWSAEMLAQAKSW